MRKTAISAAVVLACLAGSAAVAEPIHHVDHHGAADFGGGWSQNVHARPFASGAIAVARTTVTASNSARWDFDHRLLGLDADSDCPLASLTMTVNPPRRAGCK